MDAQMIAALHEVLDGGLYLYPLSPGEAEDVAVAVIDRWCARGLIGEEEIEGWYAEVLAALARESTWRT